jgi:hypothetical protein
MHHSNKKVTKIYGKSKMYLLEMQQAFIQHAILENLFLLLKIVLARCQQQAGGNPRC